MSLGGNTVCSLLPISHFEGRNSAKLLVGHMTPRDIRHIFVELKAKLSIKVKHSSDTPYYILHTALICRVLYNRSHYVLVAA